MLIRNSPVVHNNSDDDEKDDDGGCERRIETGSEVYSVAISPMGDFVLAGLGSGNLLMIDFESGEVLDVLVSHRLLGWFLVFLFGSFFGRLVVSPVTNPIVVTFTCNV